jgi:hypothetical protein
MMHIFCEGKDYVLLRLCGNPNFVLLVTSSSWTSHFTEKLVWLQANESYVCIF